MKESRLQITFTFQVRQSVSSVFISRYFVILAAERDNHNNNTSAGQSKNGQEREAFKQNHFRSDARVQQVWKSHWSVNASNCARLRKQLSTRMDRRDASGFDGGRRMFRDVHRLGKGCRSSKVSFFVC